MVYDLIKISALPAATPDESQEIVVGVGDLAKRINYGDVKADMVGTSPSYTTDTEPYLMRRTAHVGLVGKCALEKLVGGSLGWNQMIPHTASTGTSAGITFTNNNDGSWTITGTGTNNNAFLNLDAVSGQNKFIANHVYLFMPNQSGATTFTKIGFRMYGLKDTNSPYETYTPYIVKCSATPVATGYTRLQVTDANGINIGTVRLTPQVFDLTQTFGSTIADYIVSLGQANGLAWLSKYIDLGTYHAYDLGSIQSVQATEHVTLSKNFLTDFNHSSASETMNGVTFTKNSDGTITLNGTASAATTYYLSSRSVLPATVGLRVPKGSFILSGTPTGFSSYNLRLGMNRGADGTTIGNDTGSGFAFTESEGTAVVYGVWIGFNSGAVFNNVVIKPMVRYASADSTYVPYQKHTYSLGSDTLRGIPQLVSNKLQFDGDEKYPDGTINRKYTIIDLGTLNWTYESTYNFFYSRSITNAVPPVAGGRPSAVVQGYPLHVGGNMSGWTDDKTAWFDSTSVAGSNNAPNIAIRDTSYNNANAFKTAMSGVYLVYPLETPTTESSTAYQKVQTIDADGTESFVTSSPVPVGHETQTADNILAALGWLGE